MNIVRISGGLGNQMFQYAFAHALSKVSNSPCKLDISSYAQKKELDGINLVHNGFELEKVFNTPYEKTSLKEIKRLSTQPTTLFNRLRRKYFTKKTHYIDKTFSYKSELLELSKVNKKDCYYDGYWQSEKYFSAFENEIRQLFSFSNPLSNKNNELLSFINPKATASVHIRRGDYLNSPNLNVCTPQYYHNAIKKLLSENNISTFLIFSDDIQWCKDTLNLEQYNTRLYYIDWNKLDNSWQDMALMSTCNYHIIANSSFSWWGAWLDNSPNKVIIAPTPWNMRELVNHDNYYHHDYSDIVPTSWIRVPITELE